MVASRCATWLIVVAVIGCKGVSKQDFIDRFEPQVVKTFCEPKQPFRQCFDIDEAGCLALTKRVLRACVTQHESELPDKLDEDSGRQYGGMLGECAGDAYDHELRAAGKFKNTPKCNDPSAWKQ